MSSKIATETQYQYGRGHKGGKGGDATGGLEGSEAFGFLHCREGIINISNGKVFRSVLPR
jgi:hypothetical protein